MKRTLALILALMMVLALLAGCGETQAEAPKTENGPSAGSVSAPAAERRTKVTVGAADNIASLTPIMKISAQTAGVTGCVFENLGQWIGDKFTGILMKSWNKLDDKTYEVELYDYIYDSESNNLKASDIAYCVQRAADGGVTYGGYAKDIEVTGDYTFTLHLKKAEVGYFEDFCQNLWIYTQAAMEKSTDDMATDPVGTGPYICTEYSSSSRIIFEKRDNYWQKPELTPACSAANVDVIQFDIIKEAAQMAVALQTGAVQIAYWVPTSIYKDIKDCTNFTTEAKTISQMRNLVFNNSEYSIFGGEKGELLRKAFAYAIDYQALIDAGLNGLGSTVSCWGKKGTIGYNEAWESEGYYSYDPEKAKELLAQAGYPDGFTCNFWGVDNSWSRSFMQVAQAYLSQVGITVNLDWMQDSVNAKAIVDPSYGWDVYQISSNSGCGYQAAYYKYLLDQEVRDSGYAIAGVKGNEELQQLVNAANSFDWTQADVDALQNYCFEHCLAVTPFDSVNIICYVPEVESIYYKYWRYDPIIAAAEYSADWPYFAD